MFHITFVQIGVFDWLLGEQKGSIFVKMFKNLLLRNHMEDEAEYLLRTLSSTKVMFFILVRKELWLLWQLKSFHRLIMGKVEIDNFCQVIGDI